MIWPNRKYENDMSGFAWNILAIELHEKQEEIAAVIPESRRTAVCSGHRVGKTLLAAVIALWWYCTFPKARVFALGPTLETNDDVLYREIKILIAERAGTCGDCRLAAEKANPEHPAYPRPCPHSALIDGYVHESARQGIVSDDFRQIVGVAADRPEALQGRASPYLLAVTDEASGIPEPLFNSLKANLAGRYAKLFMISNPTKNHGFFYDAFHKEEVKALYRLFTMSSRDVIHLGYPEMASAEWIKEMEDEHGKDSAEFLIRVEGKFPTAESGQVFPRALVESARARHEKATGEGPLWLGVDVAYDTAQGDESAVAVIRGLKLVELWTKHGLSKEALVQEVLRIADSHRQNREPAWISADASGDAIGFCSLLRQAKNRHDILTEVQFGLRLPPSTGCEFTRDHLFFNFLAWLRRGGTIPDEAKLVEELVLPTYSYEDKHNLKQVLKKKYLRKLLGRSTDRLDACLLAAWNGLQDGGDRRAPVAIPRPNAYVQRPKGDAVYGGIGGGYRSGGDPVYGPRR